MSTRPLTERQETALLMLSRGLTTTYHAKSMPSLVRRGLVRDSGHRRLVRWEITPEGAAEAKRIQEKWNALR